MTIYVCNNVRILIFGATGSAANVLRAPDSSKIMIGLQPTKRWGSGLHGKHIKAHGRRPPLFYLYFACKSLLVKYLPSNALVLDHCDENVHRLLNLRNLLSKTKAFKLAKHAIFSLPQFSFGGQ